ncbi:hypothetical protein [Xanthomonas vesicatoria]|uniref:Uncharacterized protein n=2 Tax=Xanthomonas vesicatoria TaxID=56460 RepID=A0ABS8LG55_9XANT|nr:hypothetical protein [Xanthomonas vesicatoria]MCC8618022.1 hypothetical protein [Xanthomonas vesicatoria]MCC8624125.1 hypothetical protein [Xanthomonas vesicatoria]MCC8631708.1 hypothetical protein [Xanthomonas vesicatoria]MCC8695924.1 hypothetical protein [Xanthomonas vesicatoria]MCC8701689.1 hypothetical protein [Xanthomonas vesicatoria]
MLRKAGPAGAPLDPAVALGGQESCADVENDSKKTGQVPGFFGCAAQVALSKRGIPLAITRMT